MTTSPSAPWLTQEAYDRLSKELEYRAGEGRQEIVDRIEAARDEGDLKENGGYHAAREEQSKNEGRIAELKQLLENAVVGDTPQDDGVVEAGMVVEATVGGNEMTFIFGNREIASEDEQLDVYSERSPLGEAIHGRQAGETLSYTAPNGKDIEVVLKKVTPYNPGK
ncbi:MULTISPECIES: transcription elongation factor GreA [Auritidibacter]|uniref:Transcription elongation factor GreA n=1 Tax=Auritidibacter ignavus TaxID=678932 RepID=A0AAJ6AIZ2_9MICC|nr:MULTISPECIES: transcription elongation factor GreA [Auritidibacter]AXR73999.1 transcription elongation factor GreA [Auritidibacter sp. NML130574]NIH71785.1 transcription elongation factor GreA [Auritidibacter ignavus]PXA75973.1 transcription elongation factor GreA [Auritidibacter sp. NML100628]PXA80163.1 transcription elongation factor GreA [Auritidibacter sp. NML120636]RMX21815.1 transcription elongation factor GreA [Auritidibacter ignavus]